MLSDRTSSALAGVSKATLHDGVRIKHLFRIMTHCPDLWIQAYAKISKNKGALTKGVDNSTLDGMCQDRIENLIKMLKSGTYEPQPVRRVLIPKANGKLRPLGVPTGDDKLVQEVVRMLLELVYEPVFSDMSHGFRPERSCHTALTQVEYRWKGVKWIVDMDISGFYDAIDHRRLLAILERKIDDKTFLGIIGQMLRAGYLADWKFHGTHSGTPQGGICSPILANVYLHELDKFVGRRIEEFNKGKKRRTNPDYQQLADQQTKRRRELRRATVQGGCFPWHVEAIKEDIQLLDKKSKQIPSGDMQDEAFRRLYYVRYADDFALGVIGSKADAERIAADVQAFLNEDLGLQVASEKSGIRHAQDGFEFLGYHVQVNACNQRLKKFRRGTRPDGSTRYQTARTVHSKPWLQVPKEKVWAFCHKKGYLAGDRPCRRTNVSTSSAPFAGIWAVKPL